MDLIERCNKTNKIKKWILLSFHEFIVLNFSVLGVLPFVTIGHSIYVSVNLTVKLTLQRIITYHILKKVNSH